MSFFFFCQKYKYQDEDTTSPPEHGSTHLPGDVQPPELVQVSEKNISQIENVHGFVSHSHISPMKVEPFDLFVLHFGSFPKACKQVCASSRTCVNTVTHSFTVQHPNTCFHSNIIQYLYYYIFVWPFFQSTAVLFHSCSAHSSFIVCSCLIRAKPCVAL